MPSELGGEGAGGRPFDFGRWLYSQGSGENTPLAQRELSGTMTPADYASVGMPGVGAPAGPTGTPATPGAPPTSPGDPFTQLVNMILRSQLQGDLSKYFNPQTAMPGAGSMFTPGLTTTPGTPAGAPQGGAGPMPPVNPPMLPGGGQGAPAPAGGFTPGLPDPTMAAGYAFQPPSQSPLPTPTSGAQGPAGTNQGWLQFLGSLGIQGLPEPSLGGGSMLMGA